MKLKGRILGAISARSGAFRGGGGDGRAPALPERDTDFTDSELRGLKEKIVMFASGAGGLLHE